MTFHVLDRITSYPFILHYLHRLGNTENIKHTNFLYKVSNTLGLTLWEKHPYLDVSQMSEIILCNISFSFLLLYSGVLKEEKEEVKDLKFQRFTQLERHFTDNADII